MTVYARPGSADALMSYDSRYGNFLGGEGAPPVGGEYFENPTPVTGQTFCEVPRSNDADIDKALDAAHAAASQWGKTAAAERANILNKIADRIEENLESLALAEAWDNGKPIRETLAADLPLAVDHFRYFAGAIRAQEGSLSQIDDDTVAYHFHEPLGVVGQIIPWSFPILMATWKLAPALAAGNAVVLKPAEQTPASILYLMSLIGDLLPAGVLTVVNGFRRPSGLRPITATPTWTDPRRMPGLDAPDPSTVRRLHAYTSVWRLRADAWTSLADVTKRLADTLTPTDLRPGLQARITELVLLLDPLETYWAYPGRGQLQQIGALCDTGDYESALRLTDTV